MCMMKGYAGNEIFSNQKLTDAQAALYMAHFEKEVPQDLWEHIDNVTLANSRYMFLTRVKKRQIGYCTYCNEETELETVNHNEKILCPNCFSTCIAKKAGLSRKTLVDSARMTYYSKSKLNDQVILARSLIVKRDFSGDYKQVQTLHTINAWYIFEIGKKPVMLTHDWDGRVSLRSEIYSINEREFGPKNEFLKWSLEAAAKNTPFQYSLYDQVRTWNEDKLKYLGFFCEYPQAELFIKNGLKDLVERKVNGQSCKRAVNWKGKTLEKALGLTMNEFKTLKASGEPPAVELIAYWKYNRRRKWNLNLEDVKILAKKVGTSYGEKKFLSLAKTSSPIRLLNYLEKQRELSKYHSLDGALTDYTDYLKDCIELNYDLENDVLLFPKNLREAHQETISKIKYIADEKMNASFKKRAKSLKKYVFDYNGLIIRAVSSPQELVDEGKSLNHCVGGYAKRHADGETTILVVRAIKDLNKPYYTVEIRGNKVIQVRGKKNASADERVKKFMKAFEESKLKTKVKKTNKGVAA